MNRPDPPGSRIVLGVLGDLTATGDGHPLTDLLAQRKRVALLVYLALARGSGAATRDELTGVFWPESTESRARASLRQALRFLRGHLGADVLVNRGDAEVVMDLETVECDAVRFRRALKDGDDRSALRLYGGELLPGFVVSGTWEFDRWLQGERQRFRTEAVQAALRVAAVDAEEGELARAVGSLRWALRQNPTDEAVARRLISLLDRMGNRSEAVAVFEALSNRLAAELELEPSEETLDLVESVRAGKHDPTPAGDDSGQGGTSASPLRILVLPLVPLQEDARLVTVANLAADTLARGLAAIPELEVIPPMMTPPEGPAGENGEGYEDELARATGAGTIVSGTIHLDGDGVQVGIRITDRIRGRLLESPPRLHGSLSEPTPLLEEVRDRTVTILAPALTRRAVHVGKALPPPGIAAYQQYLDGLDHFVRGAWEAALDRFGAASRLEPDYALPRLVSAIAHWNLGRLDAARAAADEARTLDGTLGRFERGVLDGVEAWLRGDWSAGHAAASIQAAMVPGSIAHFQVAEEARRLNRPREAREVLSRLDPEAGELEGWIHYWIEITTAHHLLGDHARELELAHRCRRIHPGHPAAALTEIRALAALGRPGDVLRVVDEVVDRPGTGPPTPGFLLREAALELGAHVRDGDGAVDEASRRLLDRSVAWYREAVSSDPSDGVRRQLARTLYLAGDVDEARTLFTGLVQPQAGVRPVECHHWQLQAHLDQGFMAVIAAVLGDSAETERWCRCLESLDHPFLYGAQWFWLAAVAAVLGDQEVAVRRLRRAFAEGMPHELFLHTDPHLARLRGHEPFDRLLRPRA